MILAAAAHAHWLAGQKEQARVLNARARAASEHESRPWVWKGLYDVAGGQIDQARASFSRALEIEPDNREVRAYLELLP